MDLATASLGRLPLQFGAPAEPLFGFFHPAHSGARRGCGVLICPPVGDDLMRAHRPLRLLAERLAAAGFPVLRFDYRGTGDSAGDERGPARVRAWIDDVGLGADELRARGDIGRVVLVGLGLGGTLAMAAAARRDDVAALVLWSAHATGQAFVKEAARTHRLHRQLEPHAFSCGPPDAGGEEVLGFFLADETMRDLAALDPGAGREPIAPRALLVEADAGPPGEPIAVALGARGAEVRRCRVPRDRFLGAPPHKAPPPEEALAAICDYVAQVPDEATGTAAVPSTALTVDDEAPLVFGTRRPLFGIVSRPQVSRDLPGVVLLDAGTVHRVGPHRMGVTLARALAGAGFPVVRMDLAGIGDSPAPPDAPPLTTYPPGALGDIDEAMSALGRATGAARFVLVGLCSGADLAFKAAFNSSRVAGVVMMNPRTFCLHDLEAVDGFHKARWVQESARRPDAWLRLLRGQVDPGRAARAVGSRLVELAQARVRSLRDRLGGGESDDADVPGQLRAMAVRGVEVLLLVGDRDPGIDYVDGHFGPRMAALCALPRFARVEIPGTDHTFTACWGRRRACAVVTDHLVARFAAHGARGVAA